MTRKLLAVALASASFVALSACGSSAGGSSSGTINWWTWDDKQAAAYQSCATAFEQANPGVTVKISQYAVDDYFTKLTAGFVAGTAPDAFQNSVQFFQAYASQHQLLPLDDLISKTNFDLKKFSVGTGAWKFTDGKQYALPLDWAAAAIFYNTDAVQKAGYTPKDVENLNWNPDNGGTFDKMVAHLTLDASGKRGDEAGFDRTHVATYGMGQLAAKDFIGQTTWNSFLATTGWRQGDKSQWPTKFNYDDPNFAKTMKYIRSLTDRGFAPKINSFTAGGGTATISDVDLLGTNKIAMETAGSWEAATFAKLPGVKVGIAPTVEGPDGKTRSQLSNSNGNNIWAGTKNPDLTWKWVSYMGSEQCQATAGASGTFFPSIPAAMDKAAAEVQKQGVDLSVFTKALKDGTLYGAPAYANGADLQQTLEPLFEAYFSGSRGDDVFAEMTQKAKDILTKQN
jgi:ABC-type glycerol-3-phosphate transport system substrate-binding protein